MGRTTPAPAAGCPQPLRRFAPPPHEWGGQLRRFAPPPHEWGGQLRRLPLRRLRRHLPISYGFAVGKITVRVVPEPLELTSIRPKWARTMSRAIARPRPLP